MNLVLSEEDPLHAVSGLYLLVLLTGGTAALVTCRTHGRAQVLHERDTVLATEVYKLDGLYARLEVDTIAVRVVAVLGGMEVVVQCSGDELTGIGYALL